ncbi:hypothetical protein DL546_007831 [Coniochaeta pulveracea]|uniref:Uncharacterized protein n=1 Tax=Coniochaeta pulveracea TaxID=177199 RepID=A0A420YCU8_9PEZI|nr:hypothetical protein DL546_007831 [Coniochaeta pulveracea]
MHYVPNEWTATLDSFCYDDLDYGGSTACNTNIATDRRSQMSSVSRISSTKGFQEGGVWTPMLHACIMTLYNVSATVVKEAMQCTATDTTAAFDNVRASCLS